MNITPNSFSDGGEISTKESFTERLQQFGPIDAIDLGAESTAPMNASISWQEEWERISPYLGLLLAQNTLLSVDTYHSETIDKILEIWPKGRPLIWNDVSGKKDPFVDTYLKKGENFHYVLCHNLAPTRAESGKHMSHVFPGTGEELIGELAAFFSKNIHPQIIFDPTFGFSKTYEQNWFLLKNMDQLLSLVPHSRWLLGFSRKSFLRKKQGTTENEKLDLYHQEILAEVLPKLSGEVWVRTHRPELIVR